MLRAKKILLSAFIFWLFISVFFGVELVGGKQLNGQGMVFMVLWAGFAAQIVYTIKPDLLSGRRWLVASAITLGLTIVWALFIRAEALDSRAAAMNIVPLMLALGWAVVLRFQNQFNVDNSTNTHSTNASTSHFWLILTGLIVIWGSWLRVSAIDTFVFENDEYYHVDAAIGYLKTGEYVLWDHRLNQPQTQSLDKTVALEQTQPKEPYTRAWPYTWQVAQSIKIFGASEWAMRLPALVWGLGLLVLIPLVAYSWTKSWEVVFYSSALTAFDGSYLWASTYTRMYSMFWVLALAAIWFFVKALAASRERRVVWLWLMTAMFFTLISVLIHISGVLLVVGIFISCVVRYLRDGKNSWCAYVLLIFVVSGITVLLLHTARPFLRTAMVTLRQTVNVRYFKFPVSNIILPWLGWVVALALVFAAKVRRHDWVLLSASIFLPLTIYFAYFSPRYASRKYMAFFLFLFYILLAYAWKRFSARLFSVSIARRTIGVFVFAFLFLPMSFPGAAPSLIFKKARVDLHYLETEFHDYKKAYEIIEAAAAPGDALVILSPREYYLHRTDLAVFTMAVNREMTPEKLQKIISEHGRGWIVWPKYKRFHLTDQFVNYVNSNFKRFEKAAGTNVIIYRWGS